MAFVETQTTKTLRHGSLQLLLGSQLVGVPALSLSAVNGFWGQSSVAFAANRLLAVELGSQRVAIHSERLG